MGRWLLRCADASTGPAGESNWLWKRRVQIPRCRGRSLPRRSVLGWLRRCEGEVNPLHGTMHQAISVVLTTCSNLTQWFLQSAIGVRRFLRAVLGRGNGPRSDAVDLDEAHRALDAGGASAGGGSTRYELLETLWRIRTDPPQ